MKCNLLTTTYAIRSEENSTPYIGDMMDRMQFLFIEYRIILFFHHSPYPTLQGGILIRLHIDIIDYEYV